jgi:hypothetical protein
VVPLANSYLKGDYESASEETQGLVYGLWDSVRRALELSVQAVGENDQRLAQEVLHMKDEIRGWVEVECKGGSILDAIQHARRLSTHCPRSDA